MSDFETFLDAIALLMSWRLIGPFEARARYRLGADLEQSLRLEADPTADGYRFSGGCRVVGTSIELDLRHQEAPDLRGTLTTSIPRRMAIRLDTPTLLIAYEDIS